jgi:hypothetical protein
VFLVRVLSERKEVLVILLIIASSDTTSPTNYRKSNYFDTACQLPNFPPSRKYTRIRRQLLNLVNEQLSSTLISA